MAPSHISETDIVPGSLLSQLSALASPDTFIWSRLVDAGLSLSDPRAAAAHALVERWMLEEVPLAGQLVREILERLYRDNRFCSGTLRIGSKMVRPSAIAVPVLAVVNVADRIAPTAMVAPLVAAMARGRCRLAEYPGEIGVAVQHVALLVGRQAHRRAWPEIIAWLREHG
jgi:polyhydroxyalkanoate synthase